MCGELLTSFGKAGPWAWLYLHKNASWQTCPMPGQHWKYECKTLTLYTNSWSFLLCSKLQCEGWEPVNFFCEMDIYIYIYIYISNERQKYWQGRYILAKVLSSMSVQISIRNNWNQYTKSDQTMIQFLFRLSRKVGDMSLTPFWFSPLECFK